MSYDYDGGPSYNAGPAQLPVTGTTGYVDWPYYVLSAGIEHSVIQTDIGRWLGNDAVVRRHRFEVTMQKQNGRSDRLLIGSSRYPGCRCIHLQSLQATYECQWHAIPIIARCVDFLQPMINSLREDTVKWKNEQNAEYPRTGRPPHPLCLSFPTSSFLCASNKTMICGLGRGEDGERILLMRTGYL